MTFKYPNGKISYFDGTNTYTKSLWINEISQPINLAVSNNQSKYASYVYPRSYAPGNIEVQGICDSQRSYQELSYFIRLHQKALLDAPVTDRFARLNSGNTSGFRRLLQLSIPSEGVLQRGWIDGFAVNNKGFFEVAPAYTFSFFVVFDQMSQDIGISHLIKAAYESDDNVAVNRATPKPHEPGERDWPGDYPSVSTDDTDQPKYGRRAN